MSASFLDENEVFAGFASLSVVLATIVGMIFVSGRIAPTTSPEGDSVYCLNNVRVPFIVHNEPKWSDLSKSLNNFNQKITTCLVGLSRELDAAKLRESRYGGTSLSKSLTERIRTLSAVLQKDSLLLEEMLTQFSVQKVLPDGTAGSHDVPDDAINRQQCSTTTTKDGDETPPPLYVNEDGPLNELSAYDSAMQVLAHIVRDWTVLGRGVRSSTYGWCRLQLKRHPSSTILVPGAGLGRLAFELSQDGHSVEANELSIVMAAATNSILNKQQQGVIHPFSLDYFVNEVDHDWRKEAIQFPDVLISQGTRGSLSFTIGDFVTTYANTHKRYDAIVTCFFIDTASNIFDYLAVIHNALKDGGEWIHVGPLQWHLNAQLHPSVKELKGMAQDIGFSIQHWSVDTDAVDYRMDDTAVRSTKYDGYRPLRVVAMKQKRAKPHRIQTGLQVAIAEENSASTEQSVESTVLIEEL
jgi:N2227-like protein